jgi:suppressor of G2 allele of SKP1
MSNIRHDWFQTASTVVISIFAKKVKKEDLTVNIGEQSLEVTIKLETGSEFQLNLSLADKIDPSQSKYEILSTKLEIKLQKSNAAKWNSLEDQGQSVEKWGSVFEGESKGLSYPSSAKRHVDFDKVQVEEEKPEGDAALNQVFSTHSVILWL